MAQDDIVSWIVGGAGTLVTMLGVGLFRSQAERIKRLEENSQTRSEAALTESHFNRTLDEVRKDFREHRMVTQAKLDIIIERLPPRG